MTKDTRKNKLYKLIEQYLSQAIDARTFCDEYYSCYDLAIDSDTLDPMEKKVFSELSIIANRFTEFEEDLSRYPGVYFSEEKLKQKVIEAQNQLTN